MKSIFKNKLGNKSNTNKKGQMIVVNIMIAFTCLIAAIVFIEPLKEVIGIGRTDLNCANYAALTTGESMTCIIMDWMLPCFFGFCVGVGLAYIGARTIGGQ